ncbi:uncharacterized protein [Dysidea avara]|uniref:uncharacterized protein n=1 Tax=Dysidea avara TaxID=196820 RepID=UPI003326482E
MALQNIQSLERLSLENNDLDDDSVDIIAAVFTSNTSMNQLWISSNLFSPIGLSKLLKPLQMISTLEVLDLANSNLSPQVALDIAAVICSNKQIRQLWLEHSNLTDNGTIIILNVLMASMYVVVVLGLSHNHITCEAAGEISTAVSSMSYLSTLMLDGNELEVDGVCTIIEGVQELNWLMILSVTDNVNSEEEEEYEVLKTCFTDSTKFKLYM